MGNLTFTKEKAYQPLSLGEACIVYNNEVKSKGFVVSNLVYNPNTFAPGQHVRTIRGRTIVYVSSFDTRPFFGRLLLLEKIFA